MLCGVDPHHHLTNDDAVEVAVTARGAIRALELRQQESDYLANEIARRMSGGR